jgi:hypothetical protein
MSRRTIAWSLLGVAVAGVCAYLGYLRTQHAATDWVVFEVGARTLVHYHHESTYAGSRWDLYVENVSIQIGPPALWAVAGFTWMSLKSAGILFVGVIAALGLVAVPAAARAGSHRVGGVATRAAGVLLPAAGLLVLAIWCFEGGRDRHVDDAIALSFSAAAAALLARHRRYWWLAGILLGTGVAAKPWALILVPMVLMLPRPEIPRMVLVTIGVAAAWWAPFVIGAPDTIQALGHYEITTDPGSVLRLVGITGHVQQWLRPTQFFLGLLVGGYVCLRRDWVAAPLAALATRVLTDPYAFGYYGVGPLLFAFLYDCSGRRWRGYPVMTALTAVLEFGVPAVFGFDSTTSAVAKVLWGLSALAVAMLPIRERQQASPG